MASSLTLRSQVTLLEEVQNMSQTPIKDQKQIQKPVATQQTPGGPGLGRKVFATTLLVLAVLLVAGAVMSLRPKGNSSPSPAPSTSFLPAPQLPAGAGVPTSVNMGMPGAPKSITSLQAPLTAPRMQQFTLVAQNTIITLDSGVKIPSWTFNGIAPGPTLHVRQGDLVVVKVVNHLSFGITIHWHG